MLMNTSSDTNIIKRFITDADSYEFLEQFDSTGDNGGLYKYFRIARQKDRSSFIYACLLEARWKSLDPLSTAGEFSAIDVAENKYGLAVAGCFEVDTGRLVSVIDPRVKSGTPDNLLAALGYKTELANYYLYKLVK